MDIISQCNDFIDRLLEPICGADSNSTSGSQQFCQSQTLLNYKAAENDSNLDRILEQQSNVKYLIERDSRINSFRNLMREYNKTIEILRHDCASIALEMVTYRQQQREAQAKELERFQLQQLKFIADEQTRHQNIYEQRQKELSDLKNEYENEELDRPAYLMRVENDLQREIRERCSWQSSGLQGQGTDPYALLGGRRQTNQDDQCELDTVDEYNLYGSTEINRRPTGRGRGRGRGRGTGNTRKDSSAIAKRGRRS